MKELMGRPGTWSGLMLRLGQCLFAAFSIGFMASAIGFSNYTAFCYLIASMGLQALWSLGLACLDVYALCSKRDLLNPVLVSLFVVGDWVSNSPFEVPVVHILEQGLITIICEIIKADKEGFLVDYVCLMAIKHLGTIDYVIIVYALMVTATLSLAAACSSAGVIILFAKDLDFCKDPSRLACGRFQMSISLAFVTWFLIAISSHVMFWIVASV
ncbi:Casparian strip membrane protein domain [Dillenia turbinata]|uniref:CASP-like protein n=1 Tax=Dillenia turbinata TaxID=194707 RepID=A0AAN8ZMT2_9MAGN